MRLVQRRVPTLAGLALAASITMAGCASGSIGTWSMSRNSGITPPIGTLSAGSGEASLKVCVGVLSPGSADEERTVTDALQLRYELSPTLALQGTGWFDILPRKGTLGAGGHVTVFAPLGGDTSGYRITLAPSAGIASDSGRRPTWIAALPVILHTPMWRTGYPYASLGPAVAFHASDEGIAGAYGLTAGVGVSLLNEATFTFPLTFRSEVSGTLLRSPSDDVTMVLVSLNLTLGIPF